MSFEFPNTPRTRLAMLRVGVVPELFDYLAPTLNAQLHLERELRRIRESVMSERDDIVAHGISELEFAALGRPRSLEQYTVSDRPDTFQEAIGSLASTDSKVAQPEVTESKSALYLAIYTVYSPRKHLQVSDELIRQINYRKSDLLTSRHKQREERLKKTIEAQEFAQRVIRERLDQKRQEFLQRQAKAYQLHTANYSRYQEEQRKAVDKLKQRLESFDERCLRHRQAQLEAQQARRQMAFSRNRDAETHLLVAYYEAKYRLETKRQHLDALYERSNTYKQMVCEQKNARRRELSVQLSQSVAKAEQFRAYYQAIKRYKYDSQQQREAERVYLYKCHNMEEYNEKRAEESVRQFLFYENKLQLERYREYQYRYIINRLLKPAYMNFNYTAPWPKTGERYFYEEDELVDTITYKQGRMIQQVEKPVQQLCDDIRRFRRSPDLADYISAIYLAKQAAERLRKETAYMMAKI